MLTVESIMKPDPQTVTVTTPVTSLERLFLESGYGGFPVVDGDEFVGVVTRSDVIRSLQTERSREERISEYYAAADPMAGHQDPEESLESIAARVGVRIAHLTVGDVMSRDVISVEPLESVQDVAATMIRRHVHRLPVVESGKLVGLVSTIDFVQAVADGRLTPPAELPLPSPDVQPTA